MDVLRTKRANDKRDWHALVFILSVVTTISSAQTYCDRVWWINIKPNILAVCPIIFFLCNCNRQVFASQSASYLLLISEVFVIIFILIWKFIISSRLFFTLNSSAPNRTDGIFFWRDSPQWARASSFTRFLDHTQRCTTVGRTPQDEWSARRRDLYLIIFNTHNRQTPMPLRRDLNPQFQQASGRKPTP